MTVAHVLGFPRIGVRRELKTAVEAYWKGKSTQAELRARGRELRARHWALQAEAGLDYVAVGDFAWYDHVHNSTALFGGAPARFGLGERVDLDGYFAMARGTTDEPALAMKKWFDTNYHYLVPEVAADSRFELNRDWLLPEVREALALGYPVKVVLLGPLTWLWLTATVTAFDKLRLLSPVLRVYRALLIELKEMGAHWVQIDEPILSLDLPAEWLNVYPAAYRALSDVGPPLLLATYFGSVAERAPLLKRLPIAGLHLDLVRAPEQLEAFLSGWPRDKVLSLGVIDGRNVWRSDLTRALQVLNTARASIGDRVWVSASCSLLHVPTDLSHERKIDPALKDWLSFAVQKLDEVSLLERSLTESKAVDTERLRDAERAARTRKSAPSTHRGDVRDRVAALRAVDGRRRSPFSARAIRQREALNLPLLPTTTIGSFPQTHEIRAARAAHKGGRISAAEYRDAMRKEIRQAIEKQEMLGLDVLVHGEAERNDMVEYFGEHLEGFALTENGWVQSYGSRCVKPPVIFGDVSRPNPMTVYWARYAQSLTNKPMKGMLTGPVTMLCWSFVRDDLPRREIALQLAIALRNEVCDLEAAGIRVIQIDEPAFREGLPLRQAEWPDYLDWASRAFRVCASGIADATQIHTHMCYSQFNDILPAIAAMDADVITIETSRSRMALLDGFAIFRYPNEIGPGLYDIHSPRVPDATEMKVLLDRALAVVPAERLWVNPDCGLKTRGWSETEAALARMVAVAHDARRELQGG